MAGLASEEIFCGEYSLTIDNKLYAAIQKLIEHLGWWESEIKGL